MTIRKALRLLEKYEEDEKERKEQLEARMKENGRLFRPDHVCQITEAEFQRFLSFNGNLHWRGLQRHQRDICRNMEKLRNSLSFLIDERRKIGCRLDELTLASSPYHIKYLREAILTPILMCVHGDEYAVYNRISARALKMLESELGPCCLDCGSLGERYSGLNEKCLKLSRRIGKPLWLVDIMFSKMVHG
jgi:hypothetical protein